MIEDFGKQNFREISPFENSHQTRMKKHESARPGNTETIEFHHSDNSPKTVRPKFVRLNTQNVEESVYKGRYFETLQKESGFNKKEGYFTEYARHNKILIDQYKLKKLPSNGHSRYVSKPVFFTTLQSKNKLSELANPDHTELLKFVRQNSSQICQDTSSNSQNLKRQTSGSVAEDNQKIITNNTTPLPFFHQRKTLERNKSQSLSRHKTYIYASSKKTDQKKPNLELRYTDINETGMTNFNTLSTLTAKSDPDSAFEFTFEKTKKNFAGNIQPTLDLKSPKNVKELTRYHTRQLTEALEKCAESPKVDPDDYLEHHKTLEYQRQTSNTFYMMRKNRGRKVFSKSPTAKEFNLTEGSPKQDNDTQEQISKFEENLSGWMKSVPNFGKQRWTYDKGWEYRLI